MHHIDTLTLKPAPDAEPAAGDGRGVPPSLGRGGPRPTAPPLVTRGCVVKTPRHWGTWDTVKVGFGWFSFTCPDQYANDIIDQLTQGFNDPPTPGIGLSGYSESSRWMGSDGKLAASVSHGGHAMNGTCLLNIGGAIADAWPLPLAFRVIRDLLSIPDRYTIKRLDLWIDVHGSDLAIVQAFTDLEGLQWPRSRMAHTINPRNAHTGDKSRSRGHTAYLGSLGTPMYFRAYDKGLKSRTGPNIHHRLEAQFNDPKSGPALVQLLELDDPHDAASVIRSIVLGATDYRLDDGAVPDTFADLIKQLDAVPLAISGHQDRADARRFLEAAQRQFLGRLKASCYVAGLDPTQVLAKLLERSTYSRRTLGEAKTSDLAHILAQIVV